MGAGQVFACFKWRSIAWSLISRKKSAFQYHWRPGGYRPSNRLWRIGKGMGPAKSITGGENARIGLKTSSALPASPV